MHLFLSILEKLRKQNAFSLLRTVVVFSCQSNVTGHFLISSIFRYFNRLSRNTRDLRPVYLTVVAVIWTCSTLPYLGSILYIFRKHYSYPTVLVIIELHFTQKSCALQHYILGAFSCAKELIFVFYVVRHNDKIDDDQINFEYLRSTAA